jgi:Protein of unknown function (DUF2384)
MPRNQGNICLAPGTSRPEDASKAGRIVDVRGRVTPTKLAGGNPVHRKPGSSKVGGRRRKFPFPDKPSTSIDEVRAAVLKVWAEPAASIWMNSSNRHLQGARPADVLQAGERSEVLKALSADEWGAL